MSAPPNGPHRGLIAIIAALVGVVGGYAFHELAGFRPFVPPILSGGISMACSDLDAYVLHVSDMSDHRIHNDTVGIHRQKTIDAVNELYDRARCQATKDAAGHMTYQKLPATVVEDVDDPGPHAAAETLHPHYSHGVLDPPATAPAPVVPPSRPAVIVTNRHRSITGTLPRRTYTVDDAAGVGTLGPPPSSYMAEDVQAGTPAGAQDPALPPLHCGREANGIDWHRAGCP